MGPGRDQDAATKKFQADLKKYGGYDGVPDFGVYTGYLTADLLIKGLQAAGKNLTRDELHHRDQGPRHLGRGRSRVPPVDVSAAGFGKQPKTQCGWYVQVKDGKFVPYPSNKPLKSTLIEDSLNG